MPEQEAIWEMMIQYYGSLEALKEDIGFEAEELLAGYAVIRIPRERIPLLFLREDILWVEQPRALFYEVSEGRLASCINPVQRENGLGLTGKGILVAVLDSGIDYAHPDFRNADGTTRIAALWDQTLTPRDGEAPPEGYFDGVLFREEQINRALAEARFENRQQLVPSTDTSGHGTHVAGIACGNGRAGGRSYRGVAYESTLLVVKIGGTQRDAFPQTANLMAAIDFSVRFARERRQPLVINISFGNNDGPHNGRTLLENYMDAVALLGKNSIVVGAGNEADKRRHAAGILEMPGPLDDGMQEQLLAVAEGETLLRMTLWKNYFDRFLVALVTPAGNRIVLPQREGGESLSVQGVRINLYFGGPTPYRLVQEITIELQREGEGVRFLPAGIFRLQLTPQEIRQGNYDIWLPLGGENPSTGFLTAQPDGTLTIPSTAYRALSVAAYDSRTDSLTVFSGRGYPRERTSIKPELAAPGVDIVSCAPGGGYAAKTGTSMATPFVSGSAALLMQWGIGQGRDPYLYGERLKAMLLNGAKPLPGITQYPDRRIGYGVLCLEESIPGE